MKNFNKFINFYKEDEKQGQGLDQIKVVDASNSEKIIIDYLLKNNALTSSESKDKNQRAIKLLKDIIFKLKVENKLQVNSIATKGVYVSGPMSKYPYANRYSFYLASVILDIFCNIGEIVDPAELIHPNGSGWIEFLQVDIINMLTKTNHIVTINGYAKSIGARTEIIIAENISKLKQSLMPRYLEDEQHHHPLEKGSYTAPTVNDTDKILFDNKRFQKAIDLIAKQSNVRYDLMYDMLKGEDVIKAIRKAPDTFGKTDFDSIINERKLKQLVAEEIKTNFS